MALTASFEPSCVRIGRVVWAVDLRKKTKYIHTSTHIHTLYTYTKNAHWCYISLPRGGAIAEPIAMKFSTLIDLAYVINLVKFGYDPLQGWGLARSQILGFFLYLRSRP